MHPKIFQLGSRHIRKAHCARTVGSPPLSTFSPEASFKLV